MNNTKAKPSINEGWAVHFYDRDRHLRLTIESSHTWAFGWGIEMGRFVAIVWSALYGGSSVPTSTERSDTPLATPKTVSSSNLRAKPNRSFLFGID